jgi:hypothetical protein
MAIFAQTGPTNNRGFKKLLDKAYDFKGSLRVWAGPASAATPAAPLPGSGPSASTPASRPSDSLAELDSPATPEETAFYKKLKAEKPGEVSAFIATRKWLRAVKAMYPDTNAAIDWSKAPKAPDGLKLDYALTLDETMLFARMLAAKGA